MKCTWSSHPKWGTGDDAVWRLDVRLYCEHSTTPVHFMCDGCKRRYISAERLMCPERVHAITAAEILIGLGPVR